MPEPLKFVYHLGVHKTGTTFLQRHLTDNADVLEAQGVWPLNATHPERIELLRSRIRRLQNPKRNAPTNLIKMSLSGWLQNQATQRGAQSVVISEENLIGVPIHRELGWRGAPAGFYPHAEACLQALTHGINPAQVRVVVFTRQLPGLLSGHYSEALKALGTGDSFATFLDKTRLEEFRFDLLATRLQRALPGAEFAFRTYESVRFGAPYFVNSFLNLCGATELDGLTVHRNKVRPGLDEEQAEELRTLYHRLQAGEDANALRAQARQISQTPGNRAKPLRIPQSHIDRVQSAMRGDLSTRVLEVA